MFCPLKHMTVASSRLNQTLSTISEFKSQTHQILYLLLERCSSMRELKQIHAQIILNSLSNDTLALSKLISFCAVAKTGNLDHAQLLFSRTPEPNKFMYNSLIRGYSSSDKPIKSLTLYEKMVGSGLLPNEFTLPFVLKACACESAYWVSVLVHCQAEKLGIGSQVHVRNGLIHAYVDCGFLELGRKVFDDMSERSLVSWNSMIGGYSKVGCGKEAFLLFKEMREWGVEPDKFTFVNLLSVCSLSCDIVLGRFVHLYIVISGIEIDLIVRNALLDMYAKCGTLESAQRFFEHMPDKNVVSWTSMASACAKHGLVESARIFFDHMPVKNVVSWNSMISCYGQEGRCREALDLFHEMCNSRLEPDKATLVCALSACSQIGDLVTGKKIHDYICSNSSIPYVCLSNSLVDMYAKCGNLALAMDLFNQMPNKDLVSWNVIIGALALNGRGLEAIELFDKMQAQGILPDEITFTGLLSACSHAGLVDMGQYYFDAMNSLYGLQHEIEHYACMVDLLGRGGLLEEAVKLIGGMPMKPDIVIWGALLGACRIHGNVEIGKQILKQLLELEPQSSGVYVLVANLFSEAERWEDVKNIWKLMNRHRITKCKAISFIQVEGCVHEFMVDDKRHQTSSSIYSMLDQLMDYLKLYDLCSVSSSYSDIDET